MLEALHRISGDVLSETLGEKVFLALMQVPWTGEHFSIKPPLFSFVSITASAILFCQYLALPGATLYAQRQILKPLFGHKPRHELA